MINFFLAGNRLNGADNSFNNTNGRMTEKPFKKKSSIFVNNIRIKNTKQTIKCSGQKAGLKSKGQSICGSLDTP